jgi:hypothetical protein
MNQEDPWKTMLLIIVKTLAYHQALNPGNEQ